MARVQGGVLAARAIKAHGVDTIFTLSGGHLMPISEGRRLEGLRAVDTRHGRTAAHTAEAWGRINRACGVAVLTAGAGATGALAAVANSFVAQTPLVVIGGGAPELDQQWLFRLIMKWSSACTDADRIPEYVASAFRHALAQPRGPVYLEVPTDVLFAEAEDADARPSRTTARTFGDPRAVMKAAELLNGAERPVVIAGSGIWWDGAWKQLAFFAENGRLPIFLDGSGRGALPPGHDLLFQHTQNAALDAADVVCVIGAALDFRLRADTTLVHIHADATRLGRHHAPDAGIVGDCAAVLGILADGVKNVRADREPWLERVRQAEHAWWDERRAEMVSDASPIRAYRLGKVLDDVLDPGTIVIGDAGDAVAAVSRVLRIHRPGHWLDAGPVGCIDIGAPYALGLKAAKPDKQIVVVVAGDGAFGLGFEYETLVRLGLPTVFVIGNDAPTRYDRLTETFGGHGEHVERPDALAPALDRALASGEPAIVNVLLDSQAMTSDTHSGP